jgi:hypothetical protein
MSTNIQNTLNKCVFKSINRYLIIAQTRAYKK